MSEALPGLGLNERTLTCVGPHGPSGSRLLAALAIGVAACGGGDDGGDEGKEPATGQANPQGGKPGGKLTVLWAGDVDYIDCGQAYYQCELHDLLRHAAAAVLVQAR